MEGAGGAKFAGDEIEGVDAEGRAFEGGVGAKPFGDGGSGFGRAAGEGDVRVECADVEIEAEIEEGFVDLFAELVEARVAVAESDPENARRAAFGGKGAYAFDREEKGLHLDGRETLDDRRKKGVVDVAQKTEGDVELVLRRPAGAGQEGGAEPGDDDLDRLGKREGEEKALGGHTTASAGKARREESWRRRKRWQMASGAGRKPFARACSHASAAVRRGATRPRPG